MDSTRADRKSTRLNSSHVSISYAVFCLKKKIHDNRSRTRRIDWKEIALLYEGLVRVAPATGSLVGRAVATAQAGEPVSGFAALEQISADQTSDYQPYWAARGYLLQLLNRKDEARDAFNRAASLTDDPALREYLFQHSTEEMDSVA